MRISVLLGGGSALALVFAASAVMAGGVTYGGTVPGQCGPGGCGSPGPVGFGPGQVTNEDYPPNAAPGQCFTKVLVPEVTEAVTEQVIVSPEKTDIKVIPGECRMEEKSVLEKEESVEYFSVPATYKTVSETVVVKPGYSRTETIPAVYETITEQVKVKDGFTAWRPGSTVAGYAPGSANTYGSAPTSKPEGVYGQGVIERNPAYGGLPTRVLPTGEVLCLVEVPPEYKTITKQVLKSPARTIDIPVPAETRVITRQVVDMPARVEKKVIPAIFGTVKIKICSPDTTQPYTTPAVYNTYTKVKVVSPSRFEWKQVDCKTEVVHTGYTPPPPSYGEAPPPPPHHYAPPARVYGEALRPKPRRIVPVKTYVPAPLPPVKSYGPGKQCHTTTTCDDEPAAPMAPRPTSYAPPASAPAYHEAAIAPVSTAPVASSGDRAVVSLQAALQQRGYYSGPQNGLFTQDTLHAMVKYQNDNHLPAGRYTGETANSLGIASR